MNRLTETDLKSAVTAAGLELKQCGRHVQVVGGISIVNVYSGRKGTTIYVQGTAAGRSVSSVSEVIEAATKPPRSGQVKRAPRRRTKGVRRRKWRSSRRCHWCGVEFASFADCTADHVVPLDKGGSNGDDNIVLACSDCNTRRRNLVTAEEVRSTRKPGV